MTDLLSTHWYDRKGNRLPTDEEGLKKIDSLLGNFAYKRVADTYLPNGLWISTVWLGLDHRFSFRDGPPLIFETMVFDQRTRRVITSPSGKKIKTIGNDIYCDRYSTEQAARRGHRQTVLKFRNWKPFHGKHGTRSAKGK